jgi:threonine synthase
LQNILGLKCVTCGAIYSTRVPYTCPSCGATDGILDIQFDYNAIAHILTRRTLAARSDRSHWRYRELLPIRTGAKLPDLSIGWTPIASTDRLARHIGLTSLLIKDEGRNPTGSLKDRASSLAAVRCHVKRQKIIACAGTGNAAFSLAGMAASMGLRSVIFVPQCTPEAKLAQLLIFGAAVIRVQGSCEDAFQLCQRSCERRGWYNRNNAINPYLVEGKKTVSFEICEQLDWQPPDWVAVPVGNGCTIAGIWKGFREMCQIGLIERTPRILGIQAVGAAPVTEAFVTGQPLGRVEPQSIADSIAVGVPRNWRQAVIAVRESGGAMLNVSDNEILDAMCYTGRLSGIFAEPAAAASVAGLKAAIAQGIVGRRANCLAIVTGSGLKDTQTARHAFKGPFETAPDGAGLDDILRSESLAN